MITEKLCFFGKRNSIMGLLFSLLCFFLLSSCVSKSDLEEIRNRIDALENNQIASIKESVSSISASLVSMKQTDEELKSFIKALEDSNKELEKSLSDVSHLIESTKADLMHEITTSKLEELDALETLKKSIEEQIADISNNIESLQKKDLELEDRITKLESYVTDNLNTTKEWVAATFATLAQYNETTDAVTGIKIDISTIQQQINELGNNLNDKIDQSVATSIETIRSELKKNTDELEQKISSLENTLKNWVNEQLTNYYSIAELDAKFEALKNKYTDADQKLKDEIDKTLAELEKQKIDLTESYKKAIAEAIENNNGHINEAIQKEIKTVNDRITSVVEEINARFVLVENRLKGIEETVAEILSMIQSVNVIPTYSDGSVGISTGESEIRFEVLPLSVAQKLPDLDLASFSLKWVSTVLTKSDDGGIIPIKTVKYQDEELVFQTS